MNKKLIISLIAIFLVGLLLRFYQLGIVPSSLNWDEVSWGYNAYSVGLTGKDEYGSFLPLSFKAFGDFKQPAYVYLDVIPVLLFGLTGFAVRFPSALFGSLSIFSVFFLARELFPTHKKRDSLSLLVALLFAISPWSIQFSRVAFEANVGIFFTITGVAILLRAIRTNTAWQLFLGALVMSLSCYTYHSQKLFTPLLFLVVILLSARFWLKKKFLIIGVLGFFLFCNIFWIIDGRTTIRGRSVLFTSNQTQVLKNSVQELASDNAKGDILGKVLHNRRIIYLDTYIANYLSHFNPNYLLFIGDNPRHHPPGMGNIYFVSFPFIIIGALLLWKKQRKTALILFAWILLSPLASSLAVDSPNASRSLVFLPTWQILAAFGIVSISEYRQHFLRSKLLLGIIIALYSINFIFYLNNYFGHTNFETAYDWQYGYKEAMLYAKDYETNTRNSVYFSGAFEQPYIFYLFYAKVSPKDYIASGGSKRIYNKCFMIDNTFFGSCTNKIKNGDLFISFSDEKDNHLVKIHEINYPNEEVAIRVYSYK